MYPRFAPVRSIIILFLVYALSPLTSAYPVRHEAPRAPLIRLLLLDIVADLTAPLTGDDPSDDAEQPLEVLLKKQRAVLRKPPIEPVRLIAVPAPSVVQHLLVPPLSARGTLRAPVRVPLAGARLFYVGLSPPSRPA